MKVNKKNMIVANDLRMSHPGKKVYITDIYYTKLANEIYNGFNTLNIDFGEQTTLTKLCAAILIANYMEDIVADSGQWRYFSELCQQTTGQHIPMFHDAEAEYYPDEPSYEAVCYLIWHAAMDMNNFWIYADNEDIRRMAKLAYDILCDAFEKAPVNEQLTEDIDCMLQKVNEDFYELRKALVWVYSDCYLTRSFVSEKLIENLICDAQNNKLVKDNPAIWEFFALMTSIFCYKVGPLALYPKCYLSALMRSKSMIKEAQEIDDIEFLPMSYYKFVDEKDGEWLNLLHTSGRTLMLTRDEVGLDDETLRKHDGFGAILIKHLDKWYVNGPIFPRKDLEKDWDNLVKESPDYVPKGTMPLTGELMLEKTKGKLIFYFANDNELKKFLSKTLNYKDFSFPDKYNESNESSFLFVDKNAKKNGLTSKTLCLSVYH